jgi:hypothetical protein
MIEIIAGQTALFQVAWNYQFCLFHGKKQKRIYAGKLHNQPYKSGNAV